MPVLRVLLGLKLWVMMALVFNLLVFLLLFFESLKILEHGLIVYSCDSLVFEGRLYRALYSYIVLQLIECFLRGHLFSINHSLQAHITHIRVYSKLDLSFSSTPWPHLIWTCNITAAPILKYIKRFFLKRSGFDVKYLVNLVVESDIFLLNCVHLWGKFF